MLRKFTLHGNVVDIAVSGIIGIIGATFSLLCFLHQCEVDPLIGLPTGGVDFFDL